MISRGRVGGWGPGVAGSRGSEQVFRGCACAAGPRTRRPESRDSRGTSQRSSRPIRAPRTRSRPGRRAVSCPTGRCPCLSLYSPPHTHALHPSGPRLHSLPCFSPDPLSLPNVFRSMLESLLSFDTSEFFPPKYREIDLG